MPRYHFRNGQRVQFTPQEEAERDAEEAAQALPDALRQIQAKRESVIAAGVTHNGHTWQTDKFSQHAMASAVVLAKEYETATGLDWSTDWKTASGFVTVDLPALIAAGLVVGAYVQDAFRREADLVALAQTNVPGALAALNVGWP